MLVSSALGLLTSPPPVVQQVQVQQTARAAVAANNLVFPRSTMVVADLLDDFEVQQSAKTEAIRAKREALKAAAAEIEAKEAAAAAKEAEKAAERERVNAARIWKATLAPMLVEVAHSVYVELTTKPDKPGFERCRHCGKALMAGVVAQHEHADV